MLSRIIIFCMVVAGSSLAQDTNRMDQVVQSYVADHQFMGSVLVARAGQVLLSKGYGSANLEWDVPNSPATKFRLGSVTKQFTAASILLLEERGKLSVSDPVKKYIPDAPAAWDKITVFHLLTHTSGIPNFTSFPDYQRLEPFATTSAELVARFRDKPLEFEPGEKWNYSNSGYVLLTYLIEKISSTSYSKFLQDNIFTPLEMKDSGYDSNSAIITHRASGYTRNRDIFENAGFINMTVPQGAGALYSTTEDLLKWEQGLFGGKVLQPTSFEKMTKPFKNDYAFGLEVRNTGGHKVIEHNGGIEGFNTVMAYYPDDKLTTIVLGNVNGAAPEQIASKLVAVSHGEAVTLPGERKEITLDTKVLSHYVGAYRMEQGPVMLITLEGTQLSAKLGGQPAFPIFPESETKFFLKVVDAQIEFAMDSGGEHANQLTLHQNGRDMPAKRMDDAEAGKIMDAAAAASRRVKDQKPDPRSEAALRKSIDQLRAGKPDYDSLSPQMAVITRQQLPQLQSLVTDRGALESVTFLRVLPGGSDVYEVKFEKGALEWSIVLGPDGKIEGAGVRPR
ncbi:MAG: serine hydrolase [Acidobacteriia bacterium]|nr:serine hydrolase [Terriglobia bacterium]MBV9745075.1 serine hydrolase [Terriglobia bacterium]